jgi:hypothetical protein
MFSFLFSFDLRPPASLVAFFFLKAALLAALFVILSYMLCAFMSPRPNLVSATAEVLRDDTKEQIELEAHLYRSLAINCQEKARLTDALINLPQSKAAYRLGATTDLAPSYAVVLSQGMAGFCGRDAVAFDARYAQGRPLSTGCHSSPASSPARRPISWPQWGLCVSIAVL